MVNNNDMFLEMSKTSELERFFKLNLDLLCIADTKGNFLQVNKAWENILGYSKSELENKKFLDFVHPDDIEPTIKEMSKLAGQEQVLNFVNRYRCKDGSYKHIEWRSHPYGEKIYAAARDITDKIKEKELMENMVSFSEYLLQMATEELDFQKLTNDILTISGAKFAFFNVYDETNKFTTVAASGIEKIIKEVSSYLGFEVVGKAWNHDVIKSKKINREIVTPFKSLYDLVGEIIPYTIIETLEKVFNIGETIVVRILRDNNTIGDFILIMPKNMSFENKNAVEIYARQVGLLFKLKHMEDELKQRESLLKETQIIAGIGRWELDIFNNKLHWSDSIYDLFERNKDTFKSSYESFLNAIHPDDRNLVSEAYSNSLKNKTPYEIVHRLLMEDGRIKWVKESCRTDYDEFQNPIRSVGIVQDITDLIHSEEEMRKFKMLFDCANFGAVICDLKGTVQYVNDYFARIHGFLPEEVYNKNLSIFHNKEQLKVVKKINRRFTLEGEYRALEVWHTHKDGSVFPMLMNGMIIKNQKNDPLFMLATAIDISERKKVEIELIKMKERAESANIAKSQFLANMSHEIRTPLNGILGFLQLLDSTELNKEQKEFINNIKISSETLLSVISDILDISKIESGHLEMEEIPFDFRSTIESAIIPFSAKAKEKKIELNMLIKSDIPQMMLGDPTRLRQVITNLVSNALKFTDKGDVFIEASLEEETQEAAKIAFKVKDTGIGMSQETIQKLFKPFTQADASSTRKYGGTGLGLSICRNIISLMNGHINVESDVGKGTTFSFLVEFKKCLDVKLPDAIDCSVLKGKRILIVDDNSMNRDIAKIYLQEAGCMVQEAESATEALSKLVRNESESSIFNAVLVDYHMPGMCGHDLSAALKAISSTKNIPLILLTSIAMKGDERESRSFGFSGYLTKPYKRNDLIKCLARVLDGKIQDKDQAEILISMHPLSQSQFKRKIKILLVEDNDINRMFFIHLLKMKGLSCDIAYNGEEAITAFKSNSYDIIFMDCQMPLMDGYEATRQIRKLEGDKKHTPIIALTAYAMKGDIDKCKDAGMDDYLGKPIEVDKVTEIIDKISLKNENSSKIDINSIINTFIKETGFGMDIAKDLIHAGLRSIAKNLSEIDLLLSENKVDAVKVCLHQLKGTSGNLRMKAIAKKAMQAELFADKHDYDNLNIVLEDIKIDIEMLSNIK
ncbi:UNVERIFIED_CONTAM: PAS domain S-box-containing protein [Acetivibrio alkalicellulosi]